MDLTTGFLVSDLVQVEKDVPRTSQWLAGSAGSPVLAPKMLSTRLQRLYRVLHAFLSGTAFDMLVDQSTVTGCKTSNERISSFYMQGMNGIVFILLDTLYEDELAAYQFFRGLVVRVLPHVFSIYCVGVDSDNFDLFSSLVEVGQVFQDIVAMHLPALSHVLDRVGIHARLFVYKWFPTLFSDLSLSANHSQLRYDTLLLAWDIVLLLGVGGLFGVALALCNLVEDPILALNNDASTEAVSSKLVQVLAEINPEELVTSVCEVLELCTHPTFLKLQNSHRRRLIGGLTQEKT